MFDNFSNKQKIMIFIVIILIIIVITITFWYTAILYSQFKDIGKDKINCDILSNEFQKDTCHITNSQNFRSIKECDEVKNSLLKEYCINSFGKLNPSVGVENESRAGFVTITVDVTGIAKEIDFQYKFLSSHEGYKKGVLSVYFNGNRVYEVEENETFSEYKTARVKLDKEYYKGVYPLTLRLDRYGNLSSMEYDNFKVY